MSSLDGSHDLPMRYLQCHMDFMSDTHWEVISRSFPFPDFGLKIGSIVYRVGRIYTRT